MRAFIGDRLIPPISLRSEIPRRGRSTGRSALLACLLLRAPELRSEMHSTTEVHRVCSRCTTAAKKAESRGRNLFIVHHHAQSPFRKNGDPAREGSTRRVGFSLPCFFFFFLFLLFFTYFVSENSSSFWTGSRARLPGRRFSTYITSSSLPTSFFLTRYFAARTKTCAYADEGRKGKNIFTHTCICIYTSVRTHFFVYVYV